MLRNINSLNFLLGRLTNEQQLIDAYNTAWPGLAEATRVQTARDQLDYCSGAAMFVTAFLTGAGNRIYGLMNAPANMKRLNAETVEALYEQVALQPGPYIGYLQATQFSHECVFVRTGNQWAFYQANRTKARENFTLAPRLNNDRRNWCINDMSESQFRTFFHGLTKKDYGLKLFPYKSPPVSWDLAVFSFKGENLLG